MDRRRTVGIVKSWLRPYVPWRVRPPRLGDGVVIGRHTYGYGKRSFPIFTEGARIEVGSFCSISDDARVLGGGEHVITRASTYPLLAILFDPARRNLRDSVEVG